MASRVSTIPSTLARSVRLRDTKPQPASGAAWREMAAQWRRVEFAASCRRSWCDGRRRIGIRVTRGDSAAEAARTVAYCAICPRGCAVSGCRRCPPHVAPEWAARCTPTVAGRMALDCIDARPRMRPAPRAANVPPGVRCPRMVRENARPRGEDLGAPPGRCVPPIPPMPITL